MVGGPARAAAAVLAAGLAALPACQGAGPGGRIAVRDSAGVEIVRALAPAWAGADGWTVPPGPLVRIGVVEGDPAYQFSGLTGALRLPDGTLVAADAGSREIRFYDREGSFLRAVGGRGQGPGEFSGLASLGQDPGGRIWAWDFSLRRITRLAPGGEILGTITLGPEPPVLSPVGALPDGTFVLKQLWGARRTAEAVRTGLRRDPVALVRFDASGALIDTVGLHPGREIYVAEEEGRPVMGRPVAGRNAVAAIRPGRIVVGTQERFELREYLVDGTLLRILRLPDGDLALTSARIRELVEERLRSVAPERRAAARTLLENAPVPETRPAYEGILADGVEHLWVADWRGGSAPPRAWTVLDPRGRWLGSVTLPAGFHPFQIGREWILGSETDELGVEYLALYRLIRSPLSS